MKKIIPLFILASALLITACSSGPKKDKASALDPLWQGDGKSYSAKKFTKARAWAPGHYVVTGNLVDGRKDSVARFLVVRKEGGGWLFETTSTNREGKVSGMQMLITGYERAVNTGKTDQIKVLRMKLLQEDGNVQELEETQIMLYNMVLQSTWSKLFNVDTSFGNGGPVTVPAGTFASTSTAKAELKILFKTFKSTSWLHPDVPVNGVVRSASDDGKNITELISFGFDGKPIIK
jgi:hypothetical protein